MTTTAPSTGGATPTPTAHQDPLTGLPNRRYLYESLGRASQDSSQEAPAAVLLADLDGMRAVNDALERSGGDALLRTVAAALEAVMRSSAPEGSLLVRYAGDEFLVYVPGVDRSEALELAEMLRQAVADCTPETDSPDSVPVTVSVGVALHPADATGRRELIEAADTALFAAKAQGKNRVVSASAVDPDLDAPSITHGGFPCSRLLGREEQLAALDHGLSRVHHGESVLCVVTGTAGAGKSRLLAALSEMAQGRNLVFVATGCRAYEQARPYAVLGGILEEMLTRGDVAESTLLRGVKPADRRLLSAVIPRLESDQPPPDQLSTQDRRRLFQALERALLNLAVNGKLVVILDDAHRADQGSLDVVSHLASSSEAACAVLCAARTSELQPDAEGLVPPLTDLLISPPGELELTSLDLSPLPAEAVAEMVSLIFPKLAPPEAFLDAMATRSAGNPLYVESTLKGLLAGGKITLSAQKWVLSPDLTPEDLPENLQAALAQELGAADEEVREVLTNAATIGPDFSLKLLQTMTGRSEAEVLDILDSARKLKLIRERTPGSDEEMEFVSATVQEAQVETATPEEQEAIHQKLAEVLEASAREAQSRGALSSIIARLAYHYGRTGNVGKARAFEDRARGEAHTVYTPEEAPVYRKRRPPRIQAVDTPMDERLAQAMEPVLRGLVAAARNMMLYPTGSKLIRTALRDLDAAISVIFEEVEAFTLVPAEDQLLLNGIPVVRGHRGAALEVAKLLRDHLINSVTVARGVSDHELQVFLSELTMEDESRFNPEYWEDLFDQHEVTHIAVDQRLYVMAGSEGAQASTATPTSPVTELPDAIARKLDEILIADKPFLLSDEIKAELPGILDGFLKDNKKHQVEQVAGKLMMNLSSEDPKTRLDAARFLRETLSATEAFNRIALSESVQDSLVGALRAEEDAETFGQLASLMQESARDFVKSGNYDEVRRIIFSMRKRLETAPPGTAGLRIRQTVIDELKRLLHSEFLDILVSDLRSGDGSRQTNASKILVEFQEMGIETLVETLKETDDRRTRILTATVLREIGDTAYDQIRLQLNIEQLEDDEFTRILEVLDQFQSPERDVFPEIARGLRHHARSARRAAVKLCRRLDVNRFQAALSQAMWDENPSVARDAVYQLGALRVLSCAGPITDLLTRTEFDEVRKECCVALGKLRSEEAVKVLDAVVAKRRLGGLSAAPAYSTELRCVAAWALSQLSSREAERCLQRAKRDPEIKNWLRYRTDDLDLPGGASFMGRD